MTEQHIDSLSNNNVNKRIAKCMLNSCTAHLKAECLQSHWISRPESKTDGSEVGMSAVCVD